MNPTMHLKPLRRFTGATAALMGLFAVASLLPLAAQADDHGRGHDRDHDRGHGRYEHREYRRDYRRDWRQPDVVYAPPPVVYRPDPSPGISLFFPIDIR